MTKTLIDIHNQLIRGQSLFMVSPTYQHSDRLFSDFFARYCKDKHYIFVPDQKAVMVQNPDNSSKRSPFCRFTSLSAHSEQVKGSHAIIVFHHDTSLTSRPAVIWQAAQVVQERYRIDS